MEWRLPRRYADSTATPATEQPAIGTAAAIFEKPFTTRQRPKAI
jgi:hypothetical protein